MNWLADRLAAQPALRGFYVGIREQGDQEFLCFIVKHAGNGFTVRPPYQALRYCFAVGDEPASASGGRKRACSATS
jgi:hypothetical protein